MRRFEVQFNCLLEIGKCLFLGVALAGDVEFEALGDIPPPLAPDGGRKWSLHDLIVSQARERCTAARVPMVPTQIGSLTAPRNSVGFQHARRHDPPGVWEGRNFPEADVWPTTRSAQEFQPSVRVAQSDPDRAVSFPGPDFLGI